MKKWTSFLIFLLILSLGTACAEAPSGQWSIAEESNREFSDTLQLYITELDLSENRVTYVIENVGKDTYCCGTGADYALEILQNDVWHKMRGDPSWAVTLESHTLNPGESKEFTASLRSELPAGIYRFVKEIRLEKQPQENEYICCEFTIE